MTFRNDASQKERAAVLKNDFRAKTLQGRAVAELQMEERGRFARNVNVTAATGAPTYPAASDWTQDHLPIEPSLGFDVNAQEPVGTIAEIEASLATHRAGATQGAPSRPPSPSNVKLAPVSRKLMMRPL